MKRNERKKWTKVNLGEAEVMVSGVRGKKKASGDLLQKIEEVFQCIGDAKTDEED